MDLDRLIQSIPPTTPAAEAKTAPPVASEGETYFRFMAECAIDQGLATPNGVDVVLKALYGRGLHA